MYVHVRDLVRRKKDLFFEPLQNYGIVEEKLMSGVDPAPCLKIFNPFGFSLHNKSYTTILGESYCEVILRIGQTIAWDNRGCGVVFDIEIDVPNKDIKVTIFGEWGNGVSIEKVSISEILPYDLEIQMEGGGEELLSIDWNWSAFEFRPDLNFLDDQRISNSHP